MSKRDVLELLGPPEQLVRPDLVDLLVSDALDAGTLDAATARRNDVFTYQHVRGDVRLWSVILFTWAWMDIRHDQLLIVFDDQERLKFSVMRRDIGQG